MIEKSHLVIIICAIVSCTYYECLATRVQRCIGPDNTNSDDNNNTIDNKVIIAGCDQPPCKLLRNSSVEVEIYFTPDYDVNRLTTSVYAWIFSIPFPYLGVDGTSACENIYSLPRKTKISCPVRKGQQYVYRNSVEIKATYPKVKVTLHWAILDARNNANIFCFEVPVKIIS